MCDDSMRQIFSRLIAVPTFLHPTHYYHQRQVSLPRRKVVVSLACQLTRLTRVMSQPKTVKPETLTPKEAGSSKSTVCCVPQCPTDKPAPSLGVRAKFWPRIVARRSEKFHEWARFFSHGHSPALLCSVGSEECICSP